LSKFQLSLNQWNCLITGTSLAVEIPARSNELCAFVVVGASNPIKILNSPEIEQVRFWIRKYEVPMEYIDNDWDVCDEELVNSYHIKNISGKDQVEFQLLQFVQDLNQLMPSWKCRNPL
jgi:hypothetical protein